VGDDYDPLAGLGDDSDDSEDEGEEGEVSEDKSTKETTDKEVKQPEPGSMAPPPRPKQPTAPRNYFSTPLPSQEQTSTQPAGLSDPTLLAALKKASSLNATSLTSEEKTTEEKAKEEKRRRMLQQYDRDAQDMDMGFGSSRFADEEDFEEKKVKLSEWGGDDDGDEDGGKGDGKGKRKRGPKKRKGDGNNAADVMRVLEQRKSKGGGS
jgi:hypothetical protein